MKKVEILVYGAKALCASCANAPSSIETAAWLEAALSRKYHPGQFQVRYVDIYHPGSEEEAEFARRVIEEELWYPVVVIDGEIVAEGVPQFKPICEALERRGLTASPRT